VLVKTVDDGLFGPPKAVTLTPEAQDLLEGKWNSLYAKVMETQLDPADYRDFEQTLRRFKRSAREFDLVPTGADEVTVRNRVSGRGRIYSTGMGIWLSEFSDDLSEGLFD
jgi:hypothetical protein